MKTMLDFVKDALPEGAVIDSPKELASCYRFHFSYSGHSIKWEVPKTVAPGYEKKTAGAHCRNLHDTNLHGDRRGRTGA